MIRAEKNLRWAVVGFPLLGIASALLAITMRWTHFGRFNPFGTLGFGVFLGGWFWVFPGLRSIWKTMVFILISPAAVVLAILSAIPFVNGPGPQYSAEFVGGYVGAFVILLAALLLLARQPRLLRSIAKSLCWAIAGGVLAIIGAASAPEFHGLRMWLDPRQPDSDISLLFVWQIGMALVFALMLWFEENRSSASGS
jgi:hypothetical protein